MDTNIENLGNLKKVQVVKEPPKFQVQCLGCFKIFPKEDIKHFFCPECYPKEMENKDKNPIVAELLTLIQGFGYYCCGNTNMAKEIAESIIGLLILGCFFPFIGIMLCIRMGPIVWSYICAIRGNQLREKSNKRPTHLF